MSVNCLWRPHMVRFLSKPYTPVRIEYLNIKELDRLQINMSSNNAC